MLGLSLLLLKLGQIVPPQNQTEVLPGPFSSHLLLSLRMKPVKETFHSKIFHPYSVKISVADLEHVVAYARMCPCSITSRININYIHLQ